MGLSSAMSCHCSILCMYIYICRSDSVCQSVRVTSPGVSSIGCRINPTVLHVLQMLTKFFARHEI